MTTGWQEMTPAAAARVMRENSKLLAWEKMKIPNSKHGLYRMHITLAPS
jgi:hypothetical protein